MLFLTNQYRVIAICCLIYTAVYNVPFFTRFYEANLQSITMLASGFVFIWALHFFLFSLLASRISTKSLLAIGFLISASSSYFSQMYGVVINTDMLQNTLQTDSAEARGLMSGTLLAALLLGGLLPAIVILRLPVPIQSFKRELIAKVTSLVIAVILIAAAILPLSAQYTTFFREYKSVRYFATPITPIYSVVKLTNTELKSRFGEPVVLKRTVADDKILAELEDGSELIVMIVGETVRADHLGLNGYERQTTPRLSATEDLVTFTQFTSCGTSTAVSVPCMFSPFGRKSFADDSIYRAENILDVLARRGVAVLWRDNNSSSKGVADRVEYQSFKSPELNTVCDPECRDHGMLVGLEDYIAAHPGQDIFIVLHAMGSHGPEYYKRYPESYGQFQPTCQTNHLSQCSTEALRNSYDNTILYTDSFIADTIEFLKRYPTHETALLYVSDHGESLGENSVYLHGMPYDFAPEAQKHVAAMAWLPEHSDFDLEKTRAAADQPFSHDNLYCSLLNAFEVGTEMCNDSSPILILEADH